MATIDEEILAYTMTLGLKYRLCEPSPEKAKKVKYRELSPDMNALAAGGYGWSYIKATKAAALIAKLKNSSLVDASFAIREHHSPTGINAHLTPDYAYVEVAFCAIDDAREKEVSRHEFVANIEEATKQKKLGG